MEETSDEAFPFISLDSFFFNSALNLSRLFACRLFYRLLQLPPWFSPFFPTVLCLNYVKLLAKRHQIISEMDFLWERFKTPKQFLLLFIASEENFLSQQHFQRKKNKLKFLIYSESKVTLVFLNHKHGTEQRTFGFDIHFCGEGLLFIRINAGGGRELSWKTPQKSRSLRFKMESAHPR